MRKSETVETEAIIIMTTINPLLFNFACFASGISGKTDIYYLKITPIFAVIQESHYISIRNSAILVIH